MKIINLERNLTLEAMARIYFELNDKKAEKGDLVQMDKNYLGVVLDKDNSSIYLGAFNKKKNIIFTEFNPGTFAQICLAKGTELYSEYKEIIEKTYQEATQ